LIVKGIFHLRKILSLSGDKFRVKTLIFEESVP